MRVYRVTVPGGLQERTLESYLRHALCLIPQRTLREAFSKRDVKMDGRRASPDEKPVPGTVVEVYTPFEVSLPVVYEDDQVLLINKPQGISCEDDGRGGMTVLSILEEEAKGRYRPRLVHRLDNQTCGLLLIARTDPAEKALLSCFEERSLVKRYVCVVKGAPRPAEAVAQAFIVRDTRQKGRMRVVSHRVPGARDIATGYRTLAVSGRTARLSVDLLTGRTHQIRAHLAYLNHPILGDDVYGDRAFNQEMGCRRLMLCAAELTLTHIGALPSLEGRTFVIDPPF